HAYLIDLLGAHSRGDPVPAARLTSDRLNAYSFFATRRTDPPTTTGGSRIRLNSMDEGPSRGADTADSLSIVMEEYKSLRQEILLSLQQGHSVLQFGLATAAILVGLAAQNLTTGAGSIVLTVVVVPLVTLLIVVIWTGELRRTTRASCYLTNEVEPRVHAAFPGVARAPLGWEAWLRQGENMMFTDTYWAVPLLLALVGVASAGVGVSELVARSEAWWCVYAVLFELIALASTLIVFQRARHAVRNPPWETGAAGAGPGLGSTKVR
ncbi:MAG: hypothetical protein WKF96_19255, partial [Solirubrobacteraceae bacterium]